MTPQHLAASVAEFLAETHKDFKGSDPKIHDRPLLCIPGYIRQRTGQQEVQLPHIAVRIGRIDDRDDGSDVTLFIIHATYNTAEDDGWLEIVNMMEASRQAMLKHRFVGKKYRLELPMASEIQPEQPRPVWVGVIVATYSIFQTEEEVIY